ncbi:DL-endopeptidase inhibitor IseA family protein [Brevibacillus fluminis]|uniref:DL-endopeptidase inhibitor IseA family protein n=1 Tax=Brevibacillus fluminis TaxID=511487 RepID=UPI003F8AD0D6
MKRVIALLSFLLLVGCTGEHGEIKLKSITNPKNLHEKKKKEKVSAIDNPTYHKQDMLLFLNRAERVVEDLHFAAASMPDAKTVKEDGVTYRQMPKHLETKEAIIKHISRYWSKPLAEKIYNHLHTTVVKDKVYIAIPYPDFPMVISGKNTTIKNEGKDVVAVVTDATLPQFASDRTVTYRLVKDKKTHKYEISKRSGAYKKEIFE